MRITQFIFIIVFLVATLPSTYVAASPVAANEPTAIPENDDFDDALPITTFPFTTTLDTTSATQSPDDPSDTCGNGQNNASVWYRVRVGESGRLSLSTAGSTYDTVLALFTGTRGTLALVECNDDIVSSRSSELVLRVQSGVDYWVEVAAFGTTSGGSLVLNAQFRPALAVPLDIMLLQDETGSMGDDIASLQRLVPEIWDGVTDLTDVQFRMGVAGFRDYSISGWGVTGDWVYRPIGSLTSDRDTFAQMLSYLTVRYGGDVPESSYPAIKYMFTADHPCIDSNNNGNCSDSFDTQVGLQPSFRSGARRVLLLATDAPPHTPETTLGYPGPTQDELIALLQRTRTIVIGLVPGGPGRIPAIDALAAATGGSVQNTGSSGALVAEAIIAAISDIQSLSPTLSQIVLSATNAVADSASSVGIKVTLRDTVGRPVVGHTVLVTSQRGAFDTIEQPLAPTNENGEVFASITSAFSGTTIVGAIDISDNVPLAQQLTLTFTPANAQLQSKITATNRTVRSYLSKIGANLTSAGDNGDYFIGAVTEDAAALVTGIFLDTTKVLDGVKDTIDAARPAVYLAYPGAVSDDGWTAVLRLKEAYPRAGAFFDESVRNSVQSQRWIGMSRSVLKGGIKHYANDLFSEAADEGGLYAAEKLLGLLASQRGGLPQIAAYGASSVVDMEAMAAIERDRLLAELPVLTEAQERAYLDDLAQRTQAAIVIGAAYERQTILLDSLQGAHDTVGQNKVAGLLLRFAASSTAGAAFDGQGKLLVDSLVGSFDTYISARKLTESTRGALLAQALIKGGPEAAARMYGNTVGSYERIRHSLPPTPFNARIIAIRNYTQGRGAGPIWMEENSYSEIEIANESDTAATFEIFADYGYTSKIFFGLFTYAFMPMVETEVVEIPARSQRTVRIYYRQGARGGSPAEKSSVQFSVLAALESDNSLRLAASQGVAWQNLQRVNMDGTLVAALSTTEDAQIVENPISSYVFSEPTTQTYQAQLWIANPFSFPITADITQQLPTGWTVVSTDGVETGNGIEWQRTIEASDLVSATVTFRVAAEPGTSLQLPAATMGFIEPETGLPITTSSNSPTFTAVWPLALDFLIPSGLTGESRTLPVTLTNYLDAPLSGDIVVSLEGPGNTDVEVVTPFNLDATSSAMSPIQLPPMQSPGLYSVSVAVQMTEATPLLHYGVYEVGGEDLAPDSLILFLPLLRR